MQTGPGKDIFCPLRKRNELAFTTSHFCSPSSNLQEEKNLFGKTQVICQ